MRSFLRYQNVNKSRSNFIFPFRRKIKRKTKGGEGNLQRQKTFLIEFFQMLQFLTFYSELEQTRSERNSNGSQDKIDPKSST